MNRSIIMRLKTTLIACAISLAAIPVMAEQLFSYSAPDGSSGLRLAWRADSAWTCTWYTMPDSSVIAMATSPDLI